MKNSLYLPIYELTRGDTVESIHYGAVAVVDAYGRSLGSYGDPNAVTFLRSTAKPFQALPFFEIGGPRILGLTSEEQAIICASHSGTDAHVEAIRSIQLKAGIDETELLCGVHEPYDQPTAERIRQNKEQLSSNRHNCSGKHSGMLAYVHLMATQGGITTELSYIDQDHPLQTQILRAFAEMCDLPIGQVGLGIDGCSAPNFAVPLKNAALAYARLCDPEAGNVQPASRLDACRQITKVMTSNPFMVAGPERFDTRLMELTNGKIVSKAGAEAYQGIGLMPGALGPGSPGVGIVLKISDGDDRKKIRTAVALEVLRQLNVLSVQEIGVLADFGPQFSVENWRKIAVGRAYPTFKLVNPDGPAQDETIHR